MKTSPKTYALLSIARLGLAGLVAFTITTGSISAAPEPPATETVSGPLPGKDAKPVVVVATYSGVCAMESKDPADSWGKMTTFPIYNEKEFQKFINNRISGNPLSKDDPLLKKPQMDIGMAIGKNMALIILNPNTLSSKPKVSSVIEDKTTIWVEASHPAKPPAEKCPPGMGTYTVFIIPFSGEMKTLRFELGGK